MKIYLVPYTFKTYLNVNQFHSGIDMSLLIQFHTLKELGHDVRMFAPFGNVHLHYSGVDFISDEMPDDEKLTRNYYSNVQRIMLDRISEFQPDVILSNYALNTKLYRNLRKFGVPVIYYSHAIPGSWADLNFGDFLHDFVEENTFCCVSNFHYNKTVRYYQKDKKEWSFDEIVPDFILPPRYGESNVEVKEHDNTVRHISGMNKEKGTFFLFNVMSNTSKYDFQIFTSGNYKGFSKEQERYRDRYLNKYSNFYDHVNLNQLHDKTMEEYGLSVCNFVGLASYDTFTITSLESLARGVPLIVDVDKEYNHPAFEMLPNSVTDKYIKGIKKGKTKEPEFLDIVDSFSKLTIDDRKELSNSVLSVVGKESYMKNLQSLIDSAVAKYNNSISCSGLEGFM